MKKRVLVLGSEGMVGHVVTLKLSALKDRFEVFNINRSGQFIRPSVQMEVTDFEKLKAYYYTISPDVIINCIGLLNQTAENNPDQAVLINSYLPHFLERITKDTTAKVIHISTDCVFSGAKGGYTESDFKDGKGFYAQSKALGEINNSKDLTLRTSLIGPELKTDGVGLFNWFAAQRGTIPGYHEVYWTGVTSIEMAKAIIEAINQNITGLYQLVNNDKVSKLELLRLFRKVFDHSPVSNIEPEHKVKHDKSLINTRYNFDYKVPSYDIMIAEMKEWMMNNRHLYPHYDSLIKE